MAKIQPGFINRIKLRLKRFFVTDVPAELYACQDCGKLECSQGKWQSCERRIKEMNQVADERERHPKAESQN